MLLLTSTLPLLGLFAPAKPPPPLLVCTTAASLEGMAFCRHALRTPGEFRVRAVVRNPESSRALQLESMGAELVVADNHDRDSLVSALDGAHGLYAITTWSGSSFQADGTVVRSDNLDPHHLEESEVAQGLNILHAAERTPTLQHYLLQSMHRGGREPVDASVEAPLHHRAKWRQEEALLESTALGGARSILRQPTYLENFANDVTAARGTKLRLVQPGVISGLLAADEELTVISVDDLGALAVGMLREGPSAYDGRTLSAAAARISGRRLAEACSRVHGRTDFAYKQVPWFVLRFLIPVDYPLQLQRWLSRGRNDEGADRDGARARDLIAECAALHPQMTSLDEWLRKQGVDSMPMPPRSAADEARHRAAQAARGVRLAALTTARTVSRQPERLLARSFRLRSPDGEA